MSIHITHVLLGYMEGVVQSVNSLISLGLCVKGFNSLL